MTQKLNARQLTALRLAAAQPIGLCECDRSTGKALVARGFAEEHYLPQPAGRRASGFFITAAGRARAKLTHDTVGKSEIQYHCPLCGGTSVQLVTCPQCEEQGCVERCHPGGINCICPACEGA